MFENTRDWGEFQILQQSYLFKKKAEISALFEALANDNIDYIHCHISFYLENARMYQFPEIEIQAARIMSKLSTQGLNSLWEELKQLDIIINDYLKKY